MTATSPRSATDSTFSLTSVMKWLWVFAALLAGLVLVFFVLRPAGQLADQQRDISAAEDSLDDMVVNNQALEDRRVEVAQPREIERLAREQYGMAPRDWEVYQIQPAATAADVLPQSWPFTRIQPAAP